MGGGGGIDQPLLDYENFLRQQGKRLWDKNDREAQAVRAIGRELRHGPVDRTDLSDQSDAAAYAAWLSHVDPGVVANAVICLIHQANYLLDQQIAALERDFIHKGGYSEHLAAARLAERARQRQTGPADRVEAAGDSAPACPACGKGMVLRTARKGALAGSKFWGCISYPRCTGTRPS